jgi:hypothetical protein
VAGLRKAGLELSQERRLDNVPEERSRLRTVVAAASAKSRAIEYATSLSQSDDRTSHRHKTAAAATSAMNARATQIDAVS